MPSGTGANTLQTIPAEPFVTDPNAFFQMTEKNIFTGRKFSTPGEGQFVSSSLLQSGIVSKLLIKFDGTLTVSTAAATTSINWPYKLLGDVKLSANGQNDLFSCDGLDLHALRWVRYPAYTEKTDTFPGTVGGGDSVAVGSYTVSLTWEVPIAMDDTSLVGALFAQSSATNFQARVTQSLNTDLFSANPANAALAGTWSIQETIFEIPYDAQGRLVVPDLSRLHGFNAVSSPFTNTGDVRVPLIRSPGQLSRLFTTVVSSATNRLSALPSAAASKKIDQLRLEYGGNKRPVVYDPASLLLSINNNQYGSPAPYDRMVIDLVKENPVRDLILMQGVTELAVVPTVNSGVTVTAGLARVVQETLF